MTRSVMREKESIDHEACGALLERIAFSGQLRRAPRLREFLHYVGKRALEDGCEQVRELEIGVAVFGRPDTYDTSVDNIVRANATELRKRIEAYFETEGVDEKLYMEIPRGSYLPVFTIRPLKSDPPAEYPPPQVFPEPQIATPTEQTVHRMPIWQLVAGAVIIALCGCCAALWFQNRAMNRMMHPWQSMPTVSELWSGFLNGNRDTDLVMEDSSYLLVQNLSKQTFPFNDYLNRTYLSKIEVQDFSPEMHFAQNVVAGKILARAADVRIVERIRSLDPLASNLRIYNSREYSPGLITKDNVILLGSPTTNPWDELFESQLNFTEEPNSERESSVTNHAPTAGEQAVYNPSDQTLAYCVLAWLPKPDRSGKILLIEGTSSEATEAGGDFLLSEDQLSNFKKKLNRSKLPYFEILLRVSHVTGTPITASVVAYRTYPGLN
jgi:hypothetical protein